MLVTIFHAAVFVIAAVLWADMMRRVGHDQPTWRHEIAFAAATVVQLLAPASGEYIVGVFLVAIVLTIGSAMDDGRWWRRIIRWRAFAPAIVLLVAR